MAALGRRTLKEGGGRGGGGVAVDGPDKVEGARSGQWSARRTRASGETAIGCPLSICRTLVGGGLVTVT